jgi:hypothetical protein
MAQIKPIAMRCTEEQFNAIKPKLEKAGLVITDMESFLVADYLVNNFRDDLGIVTNLGSPYGCERPIFEEWDEQTFLEYCGIVLKEPRMVTTADIGAKVVRGKDWMYGRQDEGSVYGVIMSHSSRGWVRVKWISKDGKTVQSNGYRIGAENCYDLYYYEEEEFVLPEKWCVEITDENREVLLTWARKQPNYIRAYEIYFRSGNTLLSKHPVDNSYLYADKPSVFLKGESQYKQITFEQFQQYVLKQEPMAKYKNYTVHATDVLKIRAIACRTWKDNLTGYLREMDDNNNVTFSEEQIDAMFTAATDKQRPVLVEIFGEPKPVFIPKEGDLVWCWDRDNAFPKVGVYHTYDGTDMPYKVGNSWWNCVAPFNNGQIPEEWLKKFEAQVTSLQLQKQ